MIFISMKIVIRESQYKFLVEQTTPTQPTPGTIPTSTQPTLTPAEQQRQDNIRKREERKQANAARLAPIEAARKQRIDSWIADNPGKTEKDYWKMMEKRQSGPDVGLNLFKGSEKSYNPPPCRGGRCTGVN
jgi:hypothetical protein